MTDCSKNRKEYLDHGIQLTLIYLDYKSQGVDVFVYVKGGTNLQDVRESLDTYVYYIDILCWYAILLPQM